MQSLDEGGSSLINRHVSVARRDREVEVSVSEGRGGEKGITLSLWIYIVVLSLDMQSIWQFEHACFQTPEPSEINILIKRHNKRVS